MHEERQIEQESGPGKAIYRVLVRRMLLVAGLYALGFLATEMLLRSAGYGFATSAIIECEVGGAKAYCDNSSFGWQFFPKHMSRDFNQFIFPAEKPDNAYRIFILGASAAMGNPAPEYRFGRMLEVTLAEIYPGVDFQVITAAMPAINSHAALLIAEDCARYQPDLFIVYLGSTEVVGPYGAGTVFAPLGDSLRMIRLRLAVRATRLGQLLQSMAELASPRETAQMAWEGMAMFLDQQVAANSDDLRLVRSHFRQNLEDIAEVAGRAEAPIIFCSMASNLKDCPPFASQHRGDINEPDKGRWDQLYGEGIAYETSGDYDHAVKLYKQAAEIDGTYADLHFRLGRCYGALNEHDQAHEEYTTAREFDALRFRPDSHINAIIRTVATSKKAKGVYFLDAEELFEAHSPSGTAGAELFHEHVHPNFSGNYLLATRLAGQIETLLPKRIRTRKTSSSAALSKEQCARFLAYTDWDRYNIAATVLDGFLKRPPFTGQLYHEQQIARAEEQMEARRTYLAQPSLERAQEQYLAALRRRPKDWELHWKYGQLLREGFENPRAAAEHYRIVTELIPTSYAAHVDYGLALEAMGDVEGVINTSGIILDLNPYSVEGYHMRGLAFVQKGQYDEARACFSTEIGIRPNYIEGYNHLGILLAKQQEYSEAEEVFRKGLGVIPDCVSLRFNLAVVLTQQRRYDEATIELRPVLQAEPDYPGMTQLVELISGAGVPVEVH